jgi:hypothetical protein
MLFWYSGTIQSFSTAHPERMRVQQNQGKDQIGGVSGMTYSLYFKI